MFNTSNGYSLSDIAAVTGANNNGRGNGMFGDDWAWIIILLLCGWGNGGWGNGAFGGNGGGNSHYVGYPCATTLDVRDAVDQQTLISKLDNQTYGLADSTYGLNNAITTGFHGVDNAICTLGYQNQAGFTALGTQLAECCCDTRAAIKDGVTQGVMNTNAIQTQIANCCCDIEKSNMQNRFDAQAYNANTLQAIDRVGDRIIDYMSQEKLQSLRDENQALRLAASQSAQNAFITANQEAQTAELIRRLGRDVPVPAYVVPNPNCCYQYSVQPTCGCNTGCGSF